MYEQLAGLRARAIAFRETGPLIALVLVPVVETLILTIRFDSASLTEFGVRELGDFISAVPRFFAVMLAATLVFGGRDLSASIAKSVSLREFTGRQFGTLVGHFCSYLTLFCATWQLFEVYRGGSVFWLCIWLLSVVCTGLSWLACIVPPKKVLGLLRGFWGAVAFSALVALVTWFVGVGTSGYWSLLSRSTFKLVEWQLCVLGIHAVADSQSLSLGTTNFQVCIAPECSGLEGMGLAFVFVGSYLWWCRKDHRFPQSLLIVPIAVVLMFLGNSFRITLLILLGHFGFKEFAVGGFHSQAGWLSFNLIALGVVFFTRHMPFFSKRSRGHFRDGNAPTSSETQIATPMLLPFVALMLAVIATDAVGLEFDWLYPIRVIAVVVAISIVSRSVLLNAFRFRPSFDALAIGLAVYVLWILLESPKLLTNNFEVAMDEHPYLFCFWLLFRTLGSVVTVPVAEEFAFRGYLLRWLSPNQPDGVFSWNAILVSSLAFGALHPDRWVAGAVAGFLYGTAYYRRGALMDAILAHGTTNLLIAIHVLLLKNWALWS